jgi:hypothetical protein
MQTTEARDNLQICAGEGGRTAVYCKECLGHAYTEDGYLAQIDHKENCITGKTLAAGLPDLQVAVAG